ncbi:MAG: phosphate ABC transporter permease subunit PstC [Acidimicrobiales bacterium]
MSRSAVLDQGETGAPAVPSLIGRRRWGEEAIKVALVACALLSVGTTIAIVASLVGPTLAFFGVVSPVEFFTTAVWAPLFADARFGVLPLVGATVVITGLALAVCIPVGLLCAVYLSEYSPPRLRRWLKPGLELLAGIPTVVYGFFALTFVTPLLQKLWLFGEPPGVFNAAAAGLVMGVMIVPTVASLSEDAMKAVPQALRNGAFALGSSRFQVSTRVVVPAALSGIVAAVVLGISRAVGETMIVLVAAGGTPALSLNPADAMQTMTAFIAAAGIGDQSTGSIGYKTIFAVGSTLFVATLFINLISIRLVSRFREVYE